MSRLPTVSNELTVWAAGLGLLVVIGVYAAAFLWSVGPAYTWATAHGLCNPDIRCFGYKCVVRTCTTTYHLECRPDCKQRTTVFVP